MINDDEKSSWTKMEEAIRISERKLANFRDAIKTAGEWTIGAISNYLTKNTELRRLGEVGRLDQLNRKKIVTITDSGGFRVFSEKNGTWKKGKFRGEEWYSNSRCKHTSIHERLESINRREAAGVETSKIAFQQKR